MVYSHTSYSTSDLAQHISTDGGLHQYTYNPEGLRIGKQFRDVANDSMTVNTRYIYGAYGELIAQFDGNTVDYWNISGPDGETIGRKGLIVPPIGIGDIISMKQGTYSNYSRFYYLKDHLGSVRVTLRQNGSVVGHDDYYPFGLQMPGRSNNSANRDDDQKFTGHFLEQEGDLGIYHAQARMYDPAIGRFLGVDKRNELYPDFNSYQYGLNNPTRYTDPTGECIAELPCPRLIDNFLNNYALEAQITHSTSVGAQVSAEVLRFKGFTVDLASVELTSSSESYKLSRDGIEQQHFETSRITDDFSIDFGQSLSLSKFGFGISLDNELSANLLNLSLTEHEMTLTGGAGPVYGNINRDMINRETSFGSGLNFSVSFSAIVGFDASINLNLVRRDEIDE